jgi:hypothetical protein
VNRGTYLSFFGAKKSGTPESMNYEISDLAYKKTLHYIARITDSPGISLTKQS